MKSSSLLHYGVMMAGQLLSLFGSHIVTFSFAVWVFTLTGSVVQMALLAALAIIPTVLISPLAGVIADRAPKKKTLILVDSCLAVISLIVLFLAFNDLLQPWHLYISAFAGGAASGLQRPLFESITPMMVPKEKLVQVNGTVQTVAGISQLLSPALAGAMVVGLGLKWVLILDLITFVIAMSTLVFVSIPELANRQKTTTDWRADLSLGFRYVFDRKGLRAMFLFVTVRNFAFAVCEILALPLLLTLTTADTAGLVLSLSGLGIVAGGIFMSVTGGTKRKIDSVFLAQLLTGIAMILAAVTTSLVWLGIAVALAFVAFPVEESTSTSIMQEGVPKGIMGRVSAVRQMMTLSSVPIAMLISAPLAEYVFEPWLNQGQGGVWQVASGIVGVGEGRGMAFMLLLMGCLLLLATVLGRFYKPLVNVESETFDVRARSKAAFARTNTGALTMVSNTSDQAGAHQILLKNKSNSSSAGQLFAGGAGNSRGGFSAFFAERPYLISLALLGLMGAWMLLPSASDSDSPQQSLASSEVVKQKVQVQSISSESIGLSLGFTAQTEPAQSVKLSSELDSVLAELTVPAGTWVEKDQLLAKLNNGAIDAALKGAKAELSMATLAHKAQQELDRQGLTNRQQLANTYAQVQIAKATVNQVETQLSKTRLTAPISGVVAEHFAEQGDFLGIGQPVLSLISLDPVVAVGYVAELEVHKLHVGQPADVTLLDGRKIEAHVSFVSPISDPQTRTFKVKVTLPNPDKDIASGITTHVNIDLDNQSVHKISPALLTLNADGQIQVATVDADDVVAMYPVELVRSSAEGIWVSGVPNDVRIIVLGQGFVREGDQVDAVEASATTSLSAAVSTTAVASR